MAPAYQLYELGMLRPYQLHRPTAPVSADDNTCPLCLRTFDNEEGEGLACIALQSDCSHYVGSECFTKLLLHNSAMRCGICRTPYPTRKMTYTRKFASIAKRWPFSMNTLYLKVLLQDSPRKVERFEARHNSLYLGGIDEEIVKELYREHSLGLLQAVGGVLVFLTITYMFYHLLIHMIGYPEDWYLEV
ncbi:hypothetical protein BU23DRAFT_549474 [Bimuria novae-zelandiae CBS 107.79]|uniref:RING-type domain-containing protein n=1 Tax=Bimuria novae-zelandiae CBS 107.79 TaxID=1447943 RepID=A0A6A5VQA1_9PLEO|nr:hypothetical protein BU23DRAFT_549474 [Bimuria novae-zelandiae CBS 107.79]